MDKIASPFFTNIKSALIVPLSQIHDEKGAVLHMLRSDSPFFEKFGEIYFSIIKPKMIKAWKCHEKTTQHFAVPVGKIKLVLYNDRSHDTEQPFFEEHEMGRPDNYFLLRIPPLVWYGFQCISKDPALIANCADLPHNPNEMQRKEIADFPYNW